MIPKSLPSDLIRGWTPARLREAFGKAYRVAWCFDGEGRSEKRSCSKRRGHAEPGAARRQRREDRSTRRLSIECGVELAMAAKKDILSFIDAGREVRRAPLVGMQFLHERTV